MSSRKEPNIIIREAWGDEKEVGFRGIEHIDMPEEEMLELIDKYGDILIELDEIDGKYQGLEWCWHVGRVVNKMDDRGDFAKLNRYSDIEIGDDWTLLRYLNFYKLFPQGGYDDRISKSVYYELAVGERLDRAKNAYERLIDYHDGDEIIVPSVYEVRAWVNTKNFQVNSVVETLIREGRGQTTNLNNDKLLRGVRRVYIMEGLDPDAVTSQQISESLRDIDG